MKQRWSPLWAPHVAGEFGEPEPGEPRRIAVSCQQCGDAQILYCDSGNVRRKIAKYATLHPKGQQCIVRTSSS